jgi:hypothetical protein
MPTIDQLVTMIAGLIATAKIVYDWRREAFSDDPSLSAECNKLPDGRILLTLRAIRQPTKDYFVRRVRARGFLFAMDGAEAKLDRLVKSQAVPSPLRTGMTLPFEFWEFVVDQSCNVRKMAEIQVSISRTARRSRERWKTITIKMID